jgi:hypothetical protein
VLVPRKGYETVAVITQQGLLVPLATWAAAVRGPRKVRATVTSAF